MTVADLDRIYGDTSSDFADAWNSASSSINSFLRGLLGIGIWAAVGVATVLTMAYGQLEERKA